MKNKLDKLREAAEKLFPADGSFHENQISYLTQEAFIAGATSKEAGEYWNGWLSYPENRPDDYGKYEVYRDGCKKQHYETWNNTGWAYNNNDITHFRKIQNPKR